VSKVYTETFIRLIGGGVTKEWIVPHAKRAIVRSLVICQRTTTPTLVQAYVANTVLYYAEVPGVAQTQIFAFTAVAYAHEPIGLYESNAGCHITISGYLFDDPSDATGPPASAQQQPELPGVTPPAEPRLSWSGG